MSSPAPFLIAPFLAASLIVALPLAAPASAETREAKAHVHGAGQFTIALDGNVLEMELEIPGADIVGFEHEAKSDADKAAIKAAIALLQNPGKMFTLPAAAGCKPVKADAHAGGEDEHEDEHEDEYKAEQKDDHKAEHKDEHDHEGEAHHMAFHAQYNLTCAKPEALSSIKLNLFANFPSLKEVAVLAVTAKGQVKAEATPQQPEIGF